MERAEIAELFYHALMGSNDVGRLSRFLSVRVEWILSAADPHTQGEESPPNALTFSGRDGFRELTLYSRDRLNLVSGDLTGCISHHHVVFTFGRVRLRSLAAGQITEKNIAAKLTFHCIAARPRPGRRTKSSYPNWSRCSYGARHRILCCR
jgi:hypothetical protein